MPCAQPRLEERDRRAVRDRRGRAAHEVDALHEVVERHPPAPRRVELVEPGAGRAPGRSEKPELVEHRQSAQVRRASTAQRRPRAAERTGGARATGRSRRSAAVPPRNLTGRSSSVRPAMDFRDTPDEAAFRAEVRGVARRAPDGRVRGAGLGRRPGRRDGLGRPHRVGAGARRRPLGRACRGPRSTAAGRSTFAQQVIFNEEYAPANAPARVSFFGEGLFAPDADPVRHRRAEAAVPPEDPVGRGAVVPGLLRAERGLRPRQHPDARRARRRRVGDHRPEGVDHARAPRRLVLRRVPHRSRVDVAPRPLVPPVPDAPARRRGAAAAPDDRQRRVQRGVLRRRAHREGERARPGRRGLEGRDGDARLRARHRVPVAAARVRARAHASCSTSRASAACRTIRCSATSSRTATSACRSCGSTACACSRTCCKQGALGPEASIGKLFWTSWHRRFGETAMDVIGADGAARRSRPAPATTSSTTLHRIFMASRAETIYAGSSEIQHNIIGERVLGLPREPR